MKKHGEVIRFINYKKYILTIIILFAILLLLNIMYRVSIVFSTSYSNTVYLGIVRVFGTLFSFVPFSVFECLIIMAFLLILFTIGRLIYLIIRYHKKCNIFNFTYRLKRMGLNLVVIVLSLGIIYTLTCGINYNRLAFSICNSMETTKRSASDLVSLTEILITDANDLSSVISTDDDGYYTLQNINERQAAVEAMEHLSEDYPCLTNYYPKPKPIFFSHLMSYTQIVGIYSPFTIEANYNNDVPDLEKPYTMCHELSHLSGFMYEDEANFISYLGCMKSVEPEFKYSGTINVLITVMNEVYDVCGTEKYTELYRLIDKQVINDINYMNSYWNDFKSTAAKKVSSYANSINDAYLKTQGQSDGVYSYGRVTDLLLTYYSDEID